MIKIHHFNDAYQQHKQHKIGFRVLQDQVALMLSICQHNQLAISNPQAITQSDIDWLTQQPEAIQDYSDYLGGYVYVCETKQDLLQILGCDFDWAQMHEGQWPNVTDLPMSWDVCNYLVETTGDPQWVIFVMCWNNAGGPVYYVPKHLWVKARVIKHIAVTNATLTN